MMKIILDCFCVMVDLQTAGSYISKWGSGNLNMTSQHNEVGINPGSLK